MSDADTEPGKFSDSSQQKKEIRVDVRLLGRRVLEGISVRSSGEDCQEREAGVSVRGQGEGHWLPGQTRSTHGNVPQVGSVLRGAGTYILHNVGAQQGILAIVL